MKNVINFFSPLPPTCSAIAHQTMTLLEELNGRAEIKVWCNEPVFDERAAKLATIHRYDPERPPWHELGQAAVTFYQMGNDPRYHGDIWRISCQHPGFVILHDIKLQHFFAGLVMNMETLRREEYFNMMEFHHSAEGRAHAEQLMDGRIGIDELNELCPLSGAAVHHSLAAIVHTEDAQEAISSATSVPTAYLRLPVGRLPLPDESFIERRSWDGPYRLIVFGFLSSNRRLASILKALADFPERHRFRLDVYGTMDGAEEIVQFVCRLGLHEMVTWHGFATEEQLDVALQQSHLALNLRYPTMGEASASQLHIWQYALPALVSPAGWYAAQPKDTVGFVRPDHEIEDIQMHLSAFLQSPRQYREMGLAGRRFVNERCTTASYAKGLMELVERLPEFQAIWMARQLAERAGNRARSWFSDTLYSAAPKEIDRLVCKDFRPDELAA